jgi:RNA polymerase sigma factor (sigma-70 family)
MAEQFTPSTRLTLIRALAKGLRWEEFVAIYGRMILRWARVDFRLQDSDAENLRQEVLIRVWRGIGGYDCSKGRFRSWLYACTRNAVSNLRRDSTSASLRPLVEEIDDPRQLPPGSVPSGLDGDFEQALRHLEEEGFCVDALQTAVRSVRMRVQSATWKAFLLFEFFDMKAKEIAPLVALTPAAVNQAVHRVRRLLQEALTSSQHISNRRRPVCQ